MNFPFLNSIFPTKKSKNGVAYLKWNFYLCSTSEKGVYEQNS